MEKKVLTRVNLNGVYCNENCAGEFSEPRGLGISSNPRHVVCIHDDAPRMRDEVTSKIKARRICILRTPEQVLKRFNLPRLEDIL